jgi:ketosteroid isomerase-like protein
MAPVKSSRDPLKAEATVSMFYQCWNNGDIDGLVSCFADEAVYHDAIYLEPFIGKAALEAYFRKFNGIDGLDALKFKVAEIIADEHGCAVAWYGVYSPE